MRRSSIIKVLIASSQIMQQHITQLMCRLYRPDVLVEMPADSYGMFEFLPFGRIDRGGGVLRPGRHWRNSWNTPEPSGVTRRTRQSIDMRSGRGFLLGIPE